MVNLFSAVLVKSPVGPVRNKSKSTDSVQSPHWVYSDPSQDRHCNPSLSSKMLVVTSRPLGRLITCTQPVQDTSHSCTTKSCDPSLFAWLISHPEGIYQGSYTQSAQAATPPYTTKAATLSWLDSSSFASHPGVDSSRSYGSIGCYSPTASHPGVNSSRFYKSIACYSPTASHPGVNSSGLG